IRNFSKTCTFLSMFLVAVVAQPALPLLRSSEYETAFHDAVFFMLFSGTAFPIDFDLLNAIVADGIVKTQ
ncbi:hypothetical protein, partial [Mitsuokella multacida]|uniref:hypothetical protein n=1 Tax=Mitsuokella multacida TaxID=52226 RepID=UPI00243189F0